jgi:hypothetical protein
LNSVLEAIAAAALETERPRLITVDELRAAGALDVPAAWRKTLGVERDLFSGLFGDDDALPEQQQPMPDDADGDVSADRLP